MSIITRIRSAIDDYHVARELTGLDRRRCLRIALNIATAPQTKAQWSIGSRKGHRVSVPNGKA